MRKDVEDMLIAGEKLYEALQTVLALNDKILVGLNTAVQIVDAKESWNKAKMKHT